MQQAGEDDFLGHAGLEGARRALQHVIGGREAETEEILQRRILRHRLELLDVAAARHEQAARAASIVARFDLRLDLGDGRELLGLAGLVGGDLFVELFFHPVLERVGLGLGIHQADGCGATKTGDERSAIYLHESPPPTLAVIASELRWVHHSGASRRVGGLPPGNHTPFAGGVQPPFFVPSWAFSAYLTPWDCRSVSHFWAKARAASVAGFPA